MSTPSDNGIPMLTEVIKPDAKPVAATPTPPAAPAVARPQPAMPSARPAAGATPASATAVPLPPASILKTSPFAPAAPQAAAPEAPPKPAMPAVSAPPAVPPRQPLSPGLTTTPGGAEINTAGIASSDEWQRLESEIRQRIARQVLERIDFVLDHRIRSSVATVVDQAVDGLANDIKRGLHETLEDIVTRAVAQEIARISPLKK